MLKNELEVMALQQVSEGRISKMPTIDGYYHMLNRHET
jgi:hypothetical protein